MIKLNDLILHSVKIFISKTNCFLTLENVKKTCMKTKMFSHCSNTLMHVIFYHFRESYLLVLSFLFLRPPGPHGVIKKLLVLVQSYFHKYLD